ncbi:hypothetical protein [Amycolatopsis sp. NPDC051371]|uniref:hypothetical protein n=1 Tax=Amycolatopsis sp. NPDC051371 TaxID=3155800 RepID=UPI00341530F8
MNQQAQRFLRERGRLATATAAMLAVTAAAAPASSARDAAPTTITVSNDRYVTSDGKRVGAIPESIVGANQRWPDDGKGIWDPGRDAPAPGIVELSKQTGLHTLRYPGGTVANMFDFTRAIGPQDQRGCQTSAGFANGRFVAVDSRFGPDENERLADDIGGDTLVMVPSIGRTAADAADYVEYLNSPADGTHTNPGGGVDWAEVRARNGHPAPYGIRHWEFGNEPYLAGQHYWMSDDETTRLGQFIDGGWQHQTAQDPQYQDNDGLFTGCDLLHRQTGSGAANQQYRVRFGPIALPGDGPAAEPVVKVGGALWQRVDSFAGQAPVAHVYTVGKAAGTVRFGDGTHGAVPPAGASLSIDYTSGHHDGYVAYRDAMRKVDPSIEVCSGWGRPAFAKAMGTRAYDCLGTHSYSTPAPDGTLTRYGNLQAATADRDKELRDLRDRMAHYFPDTARRPKLLVTEYGTIGVAAPQYEARLAHVLYLAAMVAGQLENDVRVSINSNTADLPNEDGTPDVQNLFGSPPEFVRTGRAEMLSMYASMAGGHLVTTSMTGNPVLPAPAGDYPALRAVTSCDGQATRMVVVNRDAEHGLPADVKLPGPIAGPVTVSTLNGPSVDALNFPGQAPEISTRTVREHAQAGSLRHTFEPHSVTLLEFPGGGKACAS